MLKVSFVDIFVFFILNFNFSDDFDKSFPNTSSVNKNSESSNQKSLTTFINRGEKDFELLPSCLKFALSFHTKGCMICDGTKEHSLVNCEQLFSVKEGRIIELNLCQKCLHPGHSIDQCRLGDKIFCVLCGGDHLSYIYH